MSKTLRPYQQEGVERFLAMPAPHRFLLAWTMGSGKSLASLIAMKEAKVQRLLIICPAIVRQVWLREAAPLYDDVAVVEWGQKRKLTKAQSAERERAYQADVQIVSYDLLGEVQADGWDGIILDEVHALRNPLSQQSKRVRALVSLNAQACVIGLSGTLIPNKVRSVWGPVNTLFPDYLGKPSKVGDVSWRFLNRYCEKELTAYGTHYGNLRQDRVEELQQKLSHISSRVVEKDFAHFLPKLYVEPHYTDPSGSDLLTFIGQWVGTNIDDSPHLGIYTHLRETAYLIADDLARAHNYVFSITGNDTAKQRDDYLETAKEADSSIIVGTTHALSQGISLSFQKAALIVEWTTSPDQVLQFIGRFARQDSTSSAPTYVKFLVGPNDVGRSDKLVRRISDINSLFTASSAEEHAENVFKATEQSEDEFEASMAQLIEGVSKRSVLWSADDDDSDDGESFD